MQKKILFSLLMLMNVAVSFAGSPKDQLAVSDAKLIELSKGYFFGHKEFKKQLKLVEEKRGGIKEKTKQEILKTTASYRIFYWTDQEGFYYLRNGLAFLGIGAFASGIFAFCLPDDCIKSKIIGYSTAAVVWGSVGCLQAMKKLNGKNLNQVGGIEVATNEVKIIS